MQIEIKLLNKQGKVPKYATNGSAGVDLICPESYIIMPGRIVAIPTGIAISIGSHCKYAKNFGLITPRSGLGTAGLVLANTVGVIDEDYQGEVVVHAYNRSNDNIIYLYEGDRFAQMLFVPAVPAEFVLVGEFTDRTIRGEGGFGSTGV